MDLLALAEEVGCHFAFGLLGIQPLQGHGIRGRLIDDGHFLSALGHVQPQALAQDGVGGAQFPGDGPVARYLHRVDLQPLGVEVQRT